MIFHSAFEYDYLWLPLIGFIIGLLASGIGAGGGFFFLLFLVQLFNVNPAVAVSTSLAATLPICIVGTLGHYRYGHINLRIGLAFAVTGIIGAWIGAQISNRMTPGLLKSAFGIYAFLLAAHMALGNRKRKQASGDNDSTSPRLNPEKIGKGSVYGLLAGVITGTFGTGGAAPVLAGLLALRIPVKLVIGTSLLIVLVNTVFGLVAHFVVGKIDLTLVYFLGSGAVVGAFTGPKVLSGINTNRMEGRFRIWYAAGLAVIGILMIIG